MSLYVFSIFALLLPLSVAMADFNNQTTQKVPPIMDIEVGHLNHVPLRVDARFHFYKGSHSRRPKLGILLTFNPPLFGQSVLEIHCPDEWAKDKTYSLWKQKFLTSLQNSFRAAYFPSAQQPKPQSRFESIVYKEKKGALFPFVKKIVFSLPDYAAKSRKFFEVDLTKLNTNLSNDYVQVWENIFSIMDYDAQQIQPTELSVHQLGHEPGKPIYPPETIANLKASSDSIVHRIDADLTRLNAQTAYMNQN